MLAMSLGAGETTLFKMVTGYSMLANGGKKIEPTLIDRVQDRYGLTIFRHDKRECGLQCHVPGRSNRAGIHRSPRARLSTPTPPTRSPRCWRAWCSAAPAGELKAVGKPVAGKTGTSNDERDAWFIGYTPDLTVGVYVGYDNPRPMGEHATGGELARRSSPTS